MLGNYSRRLDKPSFARIDYSHPLARGLTSAYSPIYSTREPDLVKGLFTSRVGTPSVLAGQYGRAWDFPTNGAHQILTNNPTGLTMGLAQYSVFILFRPIQILPSAGNETSLYAESVEDTTTLVRYAMRIHGNSDTDRKISVLLRNLTSSQTLVTVRAGTGVGTNLAVGQNYAVCFTYDSLAPAYSIYVNGALDITSTNGTLGTVNATTPLAASRFGQDIAGSVNSIRGQIYCQYFYNRLLSLDEIAQLGANPYGILQRSTSRAWWIPQAAPLVVDAQADLTGTASLTADATLGTTSDIEADLTGTATLLADVTQGHTLDIQATLAGNASLAADAAIGHTLDANQFVVQTTTDIGLDVGRLNSQSQFVVQTTTDIALDLGRAVAQNQFVVQTTIDITADAMAGQYQCLHGRVSSRPTMSAMLDSEPAMSASLAVCA